jgi:hypothetical protein
MIFLTYIRLDILEQNKTKTENMEKKRFPWFYIYP